MKSMRSVMSMTSGPAIGGAAAAAFDPSLYGTAKAYWQADDYAAGSAANLVTSGTPYSALSLVSGSVTESAAGWNSVSKTLDFARLSDARLRATINGTATRYVVAQVMDVTSIVQNGVTDPALAYFALRHDVDARFLVARGGGWFAASIFPWMEFYGYYQALGSPLMTAGRKVWIYNSEPGVEHKLYENGSVVVNATNMGAYSPLGGDPQQFIIGNAPSGSSSAQFRWKATLVWTAITSTPAQINTALAAYYSV